MGSTRDPEKGPETSTIAARAHSVDAAELVNSNGSHYSSLTTSFYYNWFVRPALRALHVSAGDGSLGPGESYFLSSPDAFAVAAGRPHWPETRQHFRPMRLLMPLTVRKDDRELTSINAHDA